MTQQLGFQSEIEAAEEQLHRLKEQHRLAVCSPGADPAHMDALFEQACQLSDWVDALKAAEPKG